MNKQQYISQKDDKKIELLQFSPENRKLASWGENQPVTIWNIKNGMHICKLQLNNKQRVKTLEFSHDMSFLLITYSTLNSVSVIIWYYKRNQQITIHNPHLSNININQSAEIIQSIEINVDLGGIKNCFKKTQISRNCQILACYSDSNKIILWDAISGEFHKALSEHKQEIVSLDFSPNGELLASASFDSIILRNMKNDYKILYEFQNDNCKFIFIYFSPNNEILASGSTDQVIRLWNVQTGDEFDKIVNLQSLDLNSLFLFSADSNQIIFKRSKNQVQIYNIKNNNAKLIGTNPCYQNIFWGTTNSIQYSMKDFLLLGIEQLNQKCFFIWKITGDLDDEATFQRIEEHTRKINSLQLSPNELILASCDDGGIIKLWERDNEQENLFRCYQTLGKNDTFAAYKCDIQGANIDENLQKLIHQTSNRIKYQFI